MNKKRFLLIITISLTGIFSWYVIPGIPGYLSFREIANSQVSGGKMVEAGRILTVKKCIRDTPVIAPIECSTSCPLVTAALKPACAQPVAEALACLAASPNPNLCANEVRQAVECLGCEQYYELNISEAQFGNIFLGIPMTFTNYKGGGVFPQPGNQFIWLGSSNMSPYLMGIPGASAQRTKNAVDFLRDPVDFIIAGIKEVIK